MPLGMLLLLQGAVAGWCAYRSRVWLDLRGEWVGIPFVLPMALCCLVSAPGAVALFRFQPGWFLHHAVDPRELPWFDTYSFLLSVAVLFMMCGITVLGWLAVRYAVFKLNAPYCLAPSLLMLVLLVIAALVQWRVFITVGSAQQLAQGGGTPLWKHPAGLVPLLVALPGFWAGIKSEHWFKEAPRLSSPGLPPVR